MSSAKIKFKMGKDNNLLTAQDARTLSIDGEINSSSVIRKKYNYCKHKGKPTYDEIEELRGKGRLLGISIRPLNSNETIQIASDIRDVQWVQSLSENISELKRFDDEQLFPYVQSLLEELEKVVNPSPMVM